MPTARATQAQNFAGAALLVVFGAGLVVGLLGPDSLFDWAKSAPLFWIGACALLTMLSLAVGVAWMHGIDELAQRAHYVAWYWGGSMALAVLVFVYLAAPALAPLVDFEMLARWVSPAGGEAAVFSAGVFFSLTTLVLGYGLWWLVFWLRKQ